MTGLLLAGGEGRRLGGDKPLRRLGGRRLADYPLAVLREVCERVLVVGGDATLARQLEVEHVPDLQPGAGPLGGVVSGLLAIQTDWAVCLACDLPLMKPETVRLLARQLRGRAGRDQVAWDVVVPRVGGRLQPLAALYARGAAEHLAGRRGSLWRALEGLQVLVVAEDQLRTVDPQLGSFTNVNTPRELDAARRCLRSGASRSS